MYENAVIARVITLRQVPPLRLPSPVGGGSVAPMKALLAALFLVGTAMAEPAPGASPPAASSAPRTQVVLTDDELEELTFYRATHIAVTAEELAFLIEYRKREQARLTKYHTKPDKPVSLFRKVMEFVGNWWFLILVVSWGGFALLNYCWVKWENRRNAVGADGDIVDVNFIAVTDEEYAIIDKHRKRQAAAKSAAEEAEQREEEANGASATTEKQ